VEVLSATLPLRLNRRLNLHSFETVLAVDLGYINQHDFGTLQAAVSGWTQRVGVIFTGFALICSNLMILGVYIMLMMLVSWRLTLLACAFVLAASLALRWLTTSALHLAGRRMSQAATRINHVIMESLAGMKVVRLAVAERQLLGRFSGALDDAIVSQRRLARIQALSSPLLSVCAGLFICVLLLANAELHSDESTSWVGAILLFLLLLFRLMGPVSNLVAARNRIVASMNDFNALMQFYDEAGRQRMKNGDLQAPPLRRDLVFDHVGFAYKPGEKTVLDDVSLRVERGKMTAIVGPSGAGKSTLINMVARLYDPQQGSIRVDDVDLRELDIGSWRKQLAVVTQDTFIFNDTAANNIGFGHSNASMDRIRSAAEFAAAAEFIEGLPQGYDTMLGDRGVRLSGGQQQRIAIARAVFADPELLIFDEATSNLDTFTERAIQDAMEKISRSRTVLVVAHRLSTIRKADKVVVLEDGRVVEQGRHRELLARRGRYWEMVEHQRLDLIAEDAEQAVAEARA
jgi:ABC-type multidrug transport system fused ATPase/permease subunit